MMKLSDAFDVQSGTSGERRKVFTVEFDNGTCSDVMLIIDTGLMYVMQCADGKIAYDAEGKTYTPSVSEYDIVDFVKAKLAEMPANYSITVHRYGSCETFDTFEALVSAVRSYFLPREKAVVNRLLDFSKAPFVNLHWTNSYQDISVSKHIKEQGEKNMKYTVTMRVVGRVVKEVEANSPKEAIEIAFDSADCGEMEDIDTCKVVVEDESGVESEWH